MSGSSGIVGSLRNHNLCRVEERSSLPIIRIDVWYPFAVVFSKATPSPILKALKSSNKMA